MPAPKAPPMAADFAPRPTAVDNFSPLSNSTAPRNTWPATAPPAGPPAKDATAVSAPITNAVLPGLALAYWPSWSTIAIVLLSAPNLAVILRFSSSNWSSKYCTGVVVCR